jgi:NAD(P)-dependent dehydrogenase (short-subunit alcohol dehydrogenase family)/acyl carrier protein
VHPPLLDAAQHPVALGMREEMRLPFSWNGIALLSSGASELRVRLLDGGEQGASLALFDAIGTPVGGVASLIGRPFDPKQMRGEAGLPLYGLDWEVPSLSGAELSPTATWRAPAPVGQGADAAREATTATLAKIQQWLATEPEDARLAILTVGAVAAREDERPDPAAAALWGLVRAAAAEHPGRFLLIDSDGNEASEAALEQALASDPREGQLALREGELLVPRLVAVGDQQGESAPGLDPERTVLVTGATGGLGSVVVRHLVEIHGARNLLLVSRSGEWARGATGLRAQLEALEAEVEIAACDVSDRSQLEDLLASISMEHPLGAVIHCAGVLDDATIQAAGTEQVERVFAPKADAAWHLHELTRGLELSHFVLFSSLAGIIGAPGQGAYAAANCFLDALAAQRHGQGLPASAIAWGLWLDQSGMASQLAEADLARMRRAGITALSEQQGLALFDRALAGSRPLAAAARFDRAVLKTQAAAAGLPALLERIAPVASSRGGDAAGALARRLREAPEGARGRLSEDFVRAEVATVLGHASAQEIGPDDAFKDLGFDSLAAVELRNRLAVASGRHLAASVVFDYPTAATLAAHLLEQAGDTAPAEDPQAGRPKRLLRGERDRLEEASDEELLDFIDKQMGASRG